MKVEILDNFKPYFDCLIIKLNKENTYSKYCFNIKNILAN